jgi:hypothetical protein
MSRYQVNITTNLKKRKVREKKFVKKQTSPCTVCCIDSTNSTYTARYLGVYSLIGIPEKIKSARNFCTYVLIVCRIIYSKIQEKFFEFEKVHSFIGKNALLPYTRRQI